MPEKPFARKVRRETIPSARLGQPLMWENLDGHRGVRACGVSAAGWHGDVYADRCRGLDIIVGVAPEAMGTAIRRHYALLDEAIARHGGVRPVEQGEDDSVVAAFPRELMFTSWRGS